MKTYKQKEGKQWITKSINEGSFFNKCPMVSLYIDGVFHALHGDCYLHEHNGIEELIYKIESKEQEAQLLKETFGL